MTAAIALWFDFASPYSHLAIQRIEPLAAARGAEVRWRPFLLGPIFAALGWSTSPFVLQPAKAAYAWMDLAREAARHGVPWRRPSVFPRASTLAARVALAHADAPWLGAYCRAVAALNFVHDADIGEPAVLRRALGGLGQDGEACLARASGADCRPLLRAATEEAQALGLFGAPTFVVHGELFWGQDRLDDALARL